MYLLFFLSCLIPPQWAIVAESPEGHILTPCQLCLWITGGQFFHIAPFSENVCHPLAQVLQVISKDSMQEFTSITITIVTPASRNVCPLLTVRVNTQTLLLCLWSHRLRHTSCCSSYPMVVNYSVAMVAPLFCPGKPICATMHHNRWANMGMSLQKPAWTLCYTAKTEINVAAISLILWQGACR